MSTLDDLTGTWTLDPTHSELGFVVRHAMVSKVRGRFTDFHGTATVDGADLSASSVTVTITTNSIDTNNADRDGHVRGGDFFDVENHPEITFTSTSVSGTGEKVEITGDLTIKGVTRAVTIPFEFNGIATDPFGAVRAGFEGKTTINRSDFDLTFNAALETGGVLLSDAITLELQISAVREN